MALVLSKKHRYIFFHLPKNAGVSISNELIKRENLLKIKKFSTFFLQMVLGKKNNFYFSLKDKEIFFFNSHITCYDFYDLFNKVKFKEFHKFAVVRNPWDRMVSRYFYSKKINNKFKKFTFEEFIEYDIKFNLKVLNQYEFCTKDRKNFCLDSVIKFENINQDFQKINTTIFNNSKSLKHLNRTSHDNYRKYYNENLKDKIYINFKEDINNFGYEF